jgi:hypothetical protein
VIGNRYTFFFMLAAAGLYAVFRIQCVICAALPPTSLAIYNFLLSFCIKPNSPTPSTSRSSKVYRMRKRKWYAWSSFRWSQSTLSLGPASWPVECIDYLPKQYARVE